MTRLKRCPSPETMFSYIEGELPKAKVAELKKHFAECEVCDDVAKEAIKIVRKVRAEFKKKHR